MPAANSGRGAWRGNPTIPRPAPVEVLLERLLNVQPAGAGRWIATCPAHGSGTNRALSIAVLEGNTVFHCFGGCAPDAVLAAVGLSWRDLYTGESHPWRPLPPPGLRLPPAHRTDERQREWLERVWSEARPVQPNDPVGRYLRNRGLTLNNYPATLRYHPALDYYDLDAKTGKLASRGTHPTTLALVEHPQRGFVALHRTYLTEDGRKAAVACPKKLMSPWVGGGVSGAAIRLYPATERLAVAEGIETALAVHQLNQWPTWATISAGGMKELELPDSVRDVLICADHDRTGVGQDAAHTLARRLVAEGRRVRVSIPPEPDSDWLDVLTGVAE